MAEPSSPLSDYLKRWFDKPVLSPSAALRINSTEGFTTNGEGSFCPFVLSLSKDCPFCEDGFEMVSKATGVGDGRLEA